MGLVELSLAHLVPLIARAALASGAGNKFSHVICKGYDELTEFIS